MPAQALTTKASTPKDGQLDWLGVLCSLGCAIHCAAMPVLAATLPSLTRIQWLTDPLFHQVVAVICGVLVARAILPAYRLHRDGRVVALAGTGFALLFIAAFILPDACCSGIAANAHADTETKHRAQKIVLISTSGNLSAKFAHSQLPSEPKSDTEGYQHSEDRNHLLGLDEHLANETCETQTCAHAAATISRPLLTAIELESHLGTACARTLLSAQPYLSPLGGIFLIFAHVMNIRLRGCRRSACCNTPT
jgi:hypothetical protein